MVITVKRRDPVAHSPLCEAGDGGSSLRPSSTAPSSPVPCMSFPVGVESQHLSAQCWPDTAHLSRWGHAWRHAGCFPGSKRAWGMCRSTMIASDRASMAWWRPISMTSVGQSCATHWRSMPPRRPDPLQRAALRCPLRRAGGGASISALLLRVPREAPDQGTPTPGDHGGVALDAPHDLLWRDDAASGRRRMPRHEATGPVHGDAASPLLDTASGEG
jgi:hypothetical protein